MRKPRPRTVHVVKCPKQGKKRFLSRSAARTAARQIGPHASYYRCECCGDYHLTHFNHRVQKAIALVMSIGRKSRS